VKPHKFTNSASRSPSTVAELFVHTVVQWLTKFQSTLGIAGRIIDLYFYAVFLGTVVLNTVYSDLFSNEL